MGNWKHISAIRNEGIEYMRARKDGLITSVKTPWQKFNNATLDGLEWGSVTIIAGRPASGKTLLVNQITRNLHANNPGQQIAVLDLQFEMSNRATAIREFSSALNMTYKQLLSAGNKPLSESDILNAEHYAKMHMNQPIYQVDVPMSGDAIVKEVDEFVRTYRIPTVVTLDHSVLVKKNASQKDKFDVLYDLMEAVTYMKKSYPVLFLILSQMNREIENLQRRSPGTMANYPTTSDVFGADALLQHCDILIGINRPFTLGIPYYGPDQYVVTPDLLGLHFLKSRNGENELLFMEANFAHMKINEGIVPLKRGAAAPPPGYNAVLNTTGVYANP